MDQAAQAAHPEPPSSSPRSDPARAILVALCEDGPISPDVLARSLGMSRTSLLQRLRTLEVAGLVVRETVRHGVGRPRHRYDVTDAARTSLPARDDRLAATLMESIASLGGDALLEQVFQARSRLLAERIKARLDARLGPDAPLQDRVRELGMLQDEAGYVCRVAPDGDARTIELREHNCAIRGAGGSHPAACRAELQLFEEVLGARVTRTSHLAAGDRCCAYRIEARTSEPDA